MMIRIETPGVLFSSTGGPSRGQPEERPGGTLNNTILASPVLIVEDEAMIAWMMESLLEDMGFTAIFIAATGAQAVQQAERIRPRLILSDINLGRDEMDGIEAAKSIRRLTDPSVVFITAYANNEVRERIDRDVPGADLLRKPVNAEALRRAIVQVIARPDFH